MKCLIIFGTEVDVNNSQSYIVKTLKSLYNVARKKKVISIAMLQLCSK